MNAWMDQGLLDCSVPPLSFYFLTMFALMEKSDRLDNT